MAGGQGESRPGHLVGKQKSGCELPGDRGVLLGVSWDLEGLPIWRQGKKWLGSGFSGSWGASRSREEEHDLAGGSP